MAFKGFGLGGGFGGTTTTTGGFGNNNQGFGFGTQNAAPTTQTIGFGGLGAGGFGQSAQPPAAAPGGGGFGAFGLSQPTQGTSGGFGGGSFGTQQTTPSQSSGFGLGVFGQVNQPAATGGGGFGAFGSGLTQQQTQGGFGGIGGAFGTQQSSPAQTGGFGQGLAGTFGQQAQPAAPGGGGFGAFGLSQPTTQGFGGGSFGSQQTTPAQSSGFGTGFAGISQFGNNMQASGGGTRVQKYAPHKSETEGLLQSHICSIQVYHDKSPEELRLEDMRLGVVTNSTNATSGFGLKINVPNTTTGSAFGQAATTQPFSGFGAAAPTTSTGLNFGSSFGQQQQTQTGSGFGAFGQQQGAAAPQLSTSFQGFQSFSQPTQPTTAGAFGSFGQQTQPPASNTGFLGSVSGGFGSLTGSGTNAFTGFGSTSTTQNSFLNPSSNQPAPFSGFGSTTAFGQNQSFATNQTGATTSTTGQVSTQANEKYLSISAGDRNLSGAQETLNLGRSVVMKIRGYQETPNEETSSFIINHHHHHDKTHQKQFNQSGSNSLAPLKSSSSLSKPEIESAAPRRVIMSNVPRTRVFKPMSTGSDWFSPIHTSSISSRTSTYDSSNLSRSSIPLNFSPSKAIIDQKNASSPSTFASGISSTLTTLYPLDIGGIGNDGRILTTVRGVDTYGTVNGNSLLNIASEAEKLMNAGVFLTTDPVCQIGGGTSKYSFEDITGELPENDIPEFTFCKELFESRTLNNFEFSLDIVQPPIYGVLVRLDSRLPLFAMNKASSKNKTGDEISITLQDCWKRDQPSQDVKNLQLALAALNFVARKSTSDGAPLFFVPIAKTIDEAASLHVSDVQKKISKVWVRESLRVLELIEKLKKEVFGAKERKSGSGVMSTSISTISPSSRSNTSQSISSPIDIESQKRALEKALEKVLPTSGFSGGICFDISSLNDGTRRRNLTAVDEQRQYRYGKHHAFDSTLILKDAILKSGEIWNLSLSTPELIPKLPYSLANLQVGIVALLTLVPKEEDVYPEDLRVEEEENGNEDQVENNGDDYPQEDVVNEYSYYVSGKKVSSYDFLLGTLSKFRVENVQSHSSIEFLRPVTLSNTDDPLEIQHELDEISIQGGDIRISRYLDDIPAIVKLHNFVDQEQTEEEMKQLLREQWDTDRKRGLHVSLDKCNCCNVVWTFRTNQLN
jgi:hypothetical protein